MSRQPQQDGSSPSSTSCGSPAAETDALALGAAMVDSPAQTPPSSAISTAKIDDLVPASPQDADPSDAEDSASDADEEHGLIVNEQVDRQPTASRRRRDAAFQSWIQDSQRSGPAAAAAAAAGRAVDRQSTARLIQSNEDKKIIASPREYQLELFERAKEKNIIIVLDTGSGKTLIAALLLRHTLDQELERRAVGEPPRVAFFLVEKVALCFQQYSVLKANLEHPIAKFHGEMAGIMRTKDFWDEKLAKNMVFVCTAQILLDCLNNGFLRMNQVNLLIFDEAHHTKKNHPYARIIKDHYLREAQHRPRILGMTASPVDAQTHDLRASAMELESILCSEIATVSDEVLMQSQARRQQIEIKEYYDRLPVDARTPLWKQIAALLSDDALYHPHFEATREAALSLGSWCADRYWELLVTDAEVNRRAAKAETDGGLGFASDGSSEADRVLAAMRQAQACIRGYGPLKMPCYGDDLAASAFSSKFKALRDILNDAFTHKSARRCIVFVQKRYTALLLADAFQNVNQRIPGIRPSYLVGSQALSSNIANMSFRDQVLTLVRFKRGESNCLFATQVAEEGIDIPECDFIIRFDLYDSAIQYIQSKGRARQAQSTYISMLEHGNVQHLRRLKQATRDANAIRRFCSILPADRKIQDEDMPSSIDSQRHFQRVHEVEETGARLTFISSLEVLSKFVSSLASDNSMTPEYIVTYNYARKKFLATVIMPDSSPINSVQGHHQRNKQMARCSAAFEACVQLLQKKYINNHLQPTLSKRLPSMRNARLALSSNKRESYAMRIKSAVLSQVDPQAPTELFETVLVLDSPDAVGRPTGPMVLLTRCPLPALRPTMLYFNNENSSTMRLLSCRVPSKVSSDQVHALMDFTLTVFTDVFSKEFDAEPAEMPYFLAPAVAVAAGDEKLADGATCVDWKLLESLAQSASPSWRDMTEDDLNNKLVMDPWDGSRKFIIHGVNKDLKPRDPVPPGAPVPKSRAYRISEQTIAEYSNSLTIKSRRRQKWSDDQPVVNAELLPLRRNFLDENVIEMQDMRCWLVLEPLRISKLPIDAVSMALIVPVIMYRLDSLLISLEACSLLDLDIQPDVALEALTKDSSNSEEHDQEQVDFQVGMGPNYERLEFLGDAFLKMATTISLFTLIPNCDEFEYHVARMLLICNKNLFNHAVHEDRKIFEYVRSKSFDRRTWYPNLRLKRGKVPKTEVWHSLSDKSIADVCEALIGAAYMTGPEGDMDLAVKAVSKMVRSKNHAMVRFSDYYLDFKMPAWQSASASAAPRAAVDAIEKATGYRFRWPNLLRSAFKHPSYPYEPKIPNYQRLEFLGDALLDLVTVDYLFRRFPAADPQWMTEHKMAMASNHFFSCLCVDIGLQKHLLMTTSSLVGQIGEFVDELEQAKQAAAFEAQSSGGEARRDFWLSTSHPPKALSDMLEALVGAMFVDSEYDYGVVRRFFAAHIEPYFSDMELYDTYTNKHPVTALGHLLQDRLGCHSWRLYVSTVPAALDQGVAAMTDDDVVCALMLHERVVDHATARTGRDAKLFVAKAALRRFEDMDRHAYRELAGCTCSAASADGGE